jgi:hypothetical protein
MTTAAMNGNGTPVTRSELKEELARFKTELKTELKTDLEALRSDLHLDIAKAMDYVVQTLGAQMNTLRENLSRELNQVRGDLTYQIANAARVAAEEHRRELAVVDEKYRDLPGRVGLLERELDEHRRDPRAHGSRPRAPRRRPRS